MRIYHKNFLDYFIIIIFVIIFIFPIFWMIITSFKTQSLAYSAIPVWAFKPSLNNYSVVLFKSGFIDKLLNSLIVGVVSAFAVLAVGCSIAYPFVRFRIKGSKKILLWILSLRIIPPIVIIFPIYIIFNTFNLLDKHIGIIIMHVFMNLPLVVWLMSGFFRDVPIEIEEAASVDGCSRFGVFVRVVLPLVAPGLVASGLLSFIFSWNEFLFASILSGSTKLTTAPVGLFEYATPVSVLWGRICAAGTVMIIPVAIMAILIQKHMVRGLTMGAVKG